MVVAIHQPNFLPWLGFFHKIARSDVFVVLDHVQFPKTGGSWTNRVKVMIGDTAAWLTVPICRGYHGVRTVSEIEIDDSKRWRDRMRKTLETNYRKSAHFAGTMDLVADIFSYPGRSLSELNVIGIRKTLDHIGWASRTLIPSSSLGCDGRGTELLVAISKAVGANVYLCGDGAEGYQEDAAFQANDLALVRQHFRHPVYTQSRGGEFQPGLSIVDALFEIGPSATAKLLEAQML